MINLIANRLAVSIKSSIPNHRASVNVLQFSLGIVLNFMLIVTISLVLSFVFGITKEVVIVMTAFAMLRQVTGGIHLKSGLTCVIVSTTGILLVAFLSKYLSGNIIVILNILNMLLAARFAPSRIEKQSRINKKFFLLLNVLAILIVYTNTIVGSPILAAAFFAQCLTLIHFDKEGRKGN
ncbi:hypothetical protein VE23_24990 [Paenibacillus sp. D9]|uniref:accessory gene regulator ArgB-like protein n=1 Tax=Paenibacillus sp. D9 TaxID=665792 RepID=UPI00061EB97A|nr:accessory gene regulator B family protein [Paenibacillus sp. D9]KKC49556.1 hypothetical protein VE23_24990 [Paenibacillus sp. D9]